MAQLCNPSQGDWVSKALNELEELKIGLELNEIKYISKNQFKSIVKRHAQNEAFAYLMFKKNGRVSENAKGRHICYSELRMAEYLSPLNIDISIQDKKWLFKCRVDDMDVRGNKCWQFEDLSCHSCNKGQIETQRHILECEYLLGKNEILTYIPNYSELFVGDLESQVYVSRLLQENYKRRVV